MLNQQSTAETASTSKGVRAADLVAQALRRLIAEVGEAAAAKRLEPISRPTFARLASGLPCRPANLILASQFLNVRLNGTIADPEPAIGAVVE